VLLEQAGGVLEAEEPEEQHDHGKDQCAAIRAGKV
jgi:hypothetical protein